MEMGLLHRKTRVDRVLKAVGAPQLPSAVGSALADIRPPKAVTSGLAAAAVLTASSAGVSAMRRRAEGSRRNQ
jgi:hypothetical protein